MSPYAKDEPVGKTSLAEQIALARAQSEILSAFFAAVFKGKSSYSWSIWPLELEDRDRIKLHNPRGNGD